jgi:hypothetical protein
MANFNPVNPGDLITANYFNQIFTAFDKRISALEAAIGSSSGAMVITGLSPSGPLHMGDQVTVLGQNFGLPSQVIVTIDGATVSGTSFLAGSGNNALIFNIPPVQGVPPQGQLVTLAVSNPTSSATYQFILLPYVLTIPTGQLFVSMTGAPGVASITAGNSYIFVFTITSSTSLTDAYTLAASLDSASAAALWTVATVVPSGAQMGNPLNQVTIQNGQNITTTVGVKVTIPATPVVSSAQVTLTVTSKTNPTGLFGSGATSVPASGNPPPPNAISITIAAVTANLAGATFTGTSITLPHGSTSAVVALQALCPNADSYACTGPTFGAAGWAGSIVKPPSPFTTTAANQSVVIQIQVTGIPAGPASTALGFKVNSTTQATVVGQISPSINVL